MVLAEETVVGRLTLPRPGWDGAITSSRALGRAGRGTETGGGGFWGRRGIAAAPRDPFAGRLGQVLKCSRISRDVNSAPHPQPQGILT